MKLVLASASPRRREILERLGIEFDAVAPDVDELTEGDPEEVVLENARRKARAGLEQVGEGEVVALGADTEVVHAGRVLGKAATEAEARERLEALSGRTHEVLGGVVLLETGALRDIRNKAPHGVATERSGVAISYVTFHSLDPALLELYLRSGEWRGKAGAYAIQGLGSVLVERLEGDFANVVGLSVRLLLQLAPALFGRVSGPRGTERPHRRGNGENL